MYVLSISSVSEVLMVLNLPSTHFSALGVLEYRIAFASLCTCVDLQFATTSDGLVHKYLPHCDPGEGAGLRMYGCRMCVTAVLNTWTVRMAASSSVPVALVVRASPQAYQRRRWHTNNINPVLAHSRSI